MAAGAALGLAEMIASGTTCIADMYMRTGVIAKTVLEAGISANLSCGGLYFGDPADFSPETCNDCKNQIALTEVLIVCSQVFQLNRMLYGTHKSPVPVEIL